MKTATFTQRALMSKADLALHPWTYDVVLQTEILNLMNQVAKARMRTVAPVKISVSWVRPVGTKQRLMVRTVQRLATARQVKLTVQAVPR